MAFNNNEISTSELLELLYQRGYRIKIETKGDTQFASFYHPHALEESVVTYQYSTDFTHEEVRKDLAWTLLKWTGLKVKYTLDY